MESELVSDSFSDEGGNESVQTMFSPFAYTKFFYKCLPYYLAIGMTADEYWKGDCTLTESYREAFNLKKDLQNEQLWLQGLYNYEALTDVLPAIVSLGKTKPKKYSDKPYPMSKVEAENRKRSKAKRQFLNMKETMKNLAESVNKKFTKKEG